MVPLKFTVKVLSSSSPFKPFMLTVALVAGLMVTACCCPASSESVAGMTSHVPVVSISTVSVPLLKLKSYKVGTPLLDVHCQNRLNHIHADIVHVHSPFIAGHAGISYAHKQGCPVVGTFHSKYYDDFLQVTGFSALATLGAKYVANLYEKCDEVWAVNESSAETLHSYGFRGDIRVVYNGTDIDEVDNAAAFSTPFSATASTRFISETFA